MALTEIYNAAGLTQREQQQMPEFLDLTNFFYGSSAYEKLYEYFAFDSCEMPRGIAKARTGDPDYWILEYLEVRV